MKVTRFVSFPVLLAFALICGFVLAQSPHAAPLSVERDDPPASPNAAGVFVPGEVLQYKVSYLSIRLGTIIMKIDSLVVENGRRAWIAHAYIDSRNGITVRQSPYDFSVRY